MAESSTATTTPAPSAWVHDVGTPILSKLHCWEKSGSLGGFGTDPWDR